MTRRAASARLVVPVGESDHTLGPETAQVTLVEYGDYQCPACGEAYPIVKELLARLGQRVRFVFRNFPLATIHPHAEGAAEAAEAARAQGQFWPMHDLLFEHQEALGDEDLVGYGSALGLDESRFVGELTEHVHAVRVREDFMGGVRSGVNGTPTFFINEERHDGPFDLDNLLGAIEVEIGAATARDGFDHSTRHHPRRA
ncbi:MAG TPA: thioredoxin domain-containing protein [Gemmataceae bacterium]|nr:thioredoxin domain-containing protein [Gemmataceae bacterium]